MRNGQGFSLKLSSTLSGLSSDICRVVEECGQQQQCGFFEECTIFEDEICEPAGVGSGVQQNVQFQQGLIIGGGNGVGGGSKRQQQVVASTVQTARNGSLIGQGGAVGIAGTGAAGAIGANCRIVEDEVCDEAVGAAAAAACRQVEEEECETVQDSVCGTVLERECQQFLGEQCREAPSTAEEQCVIVNEEVK